MNGSVTYGILLVLLFVLIVIGCAMLASHFRTRRPRTEAHHGNPVLDPSGFADIDLKRKADSRTGTGESTDPGQGRPGS